MINLDKYQGATQGERYQNAVVELLEKILTAVEGNKTSDVEMLSESELDTVKTMQENIEKKSRKKSKK